MSEEKDLKPCIHCGEPSPIFEVQLGDFATLTYLRLCSDRCLFYLAWDFLYDLYEHKTFRGRLYDLQNKEDSALLEKHHEEARKAFSENMRKHFEENKDILTKANPISIHQPFSHKIPTTASTPMRFVRSSKEERIGYQRRYIEKHKVLLAEAEKDLEQLLNEGP